VAAKLKFSAKQIWDILGTVPDPEIPVISVVDLGIIRDVKWKDDVLNVTLTPTYSGCPATAAITLDVETALLSKGVERVKIINQLSPAWTTDWISAAGREKLKAYGIAPPVGEATCAGMFKIGASDSPVINCPRCDSVKTERISQFGSTPCKASYRCMDCLEPFDYFKTF
jgi:ring-1,2-phenylacetyl-CoA epoxidase subunit PaaD